VNPEPAIVTLAPAAADSGENDDSFGDTLNTAALSPLPSGVVTPTFPVFASAGTVARTCVEDKTVGAAVTPPNVTAVAPPKFAPETVTTVPTAPDVGVKLETVGTAGAVTVKFVALVAFPSGAATEIFPLVAPVGTVAVICVLESTVKVVAAVPLNETAVAPVKSPPWIVTLVPTRPEVGAKLEIATGPQLGNLNEPIRVCHPRSLVVGKYSFAYQKVQSSVGSTLMLE